MSGARSIAEEIAEEIATVLIVPVAVDVLTGKRGPEILRTVEAAALELIGKHLVICNEAVLAADLRALVDHFRLGGPCPIDTEGKRGPG